MNYNELRKEFAHNENEDDEQFTLKEIISSLPEPEQIIILLYAEEQSMRKVAKTLDVSTTTAYLRIKDIRNKIKEKL